MENIKERLRSLVVEVGVGEDGKLTAHSDSEPLFCIVHDNIDDVRAAVLKVITSYIRHFGGGDDVDIDLEDRPLIPVRKIKPQSALVPRFRMCA